MISNFIGKNTERIFEKHLRMNNILFFRIKDGGRLTKNSLFIRTPQLCDYIILKDKKIMLVDLKYNGNKDKVLKSKFISKTETSTTRQYSNFMKILKSDFKNCGFVFFFEHDFYYLPIEYMDQCFKKQKSIKLEDKFFNA